MPNQLSNQKKNPYLSIAKFGTRHVVTFMLFLGMANAYVMRTNMSVAIVAMVNHTEIELRSSGKESNLTLVDECPGREIQDESELVIGKPNKFNIISNLT